MTTYTACDRQVPPFKKDSPRRIDRVIDYFGERQASAAGHDARAEQFVGVWRPIAATSVALVILLAFALAGLEVAASRVPPMSAPLGNDVAVAP